MAIAKKPKGNRSAATQEAPDAAAQKFISGADASHDEPSQEDSRKVPIMVRFDRALLQRVDAAAKHRGISRSSWIQFTLSRALDQGEG
jgi:predicted HicB family RNase H-like nuclease